MVLDKSRYLGSEKAELLWDLPGVSAQALRPNRARNLEIIRSPSLS